MGTPLGLPSMQQAVVWSTEGPRALKAPVLAGPAAAQDLCFHRGHSGLHQGPPSPVPQVLLPAAWPPDALPPFPSSTP